MTYTPEQIAGAESHPVLGAEYFASRDVADKLLEHWNEEHADKLSEEIVKPLLDIIHERVNDAFRDYLLSDAEDNLHSAMRRMVEDTVGALIGGERWANAKYIETEYRDGQKVREALAKLHSDPIKDGRIADLEKEIVRLKKDVELYRRNGGY